MEHGRHRQHGIVAAQTEAIRKGLCKRVKHQGAVGVDDALRATRGPGGKAHRGAIVFVDFWIPKIVAGFRKQFFVI